MRKKVLIGVVALLVVAAAVAVGFMLGQGGDKAGEKPTPSTGGGNKDYEKVIKEYFQAIEQFDSEKFASLSVYSLHDGFFFDDIKEYLQNEFGRSIETTYTILDAEYFSVSDYYDIYNDVLSSGFSNWFLDSIPWLEALEPKELVKVNVKFHIRGTEDSQSGTDSFELAKVNNRWYTVQDPFILN